MSLLLKRLMGLKSIRPKNELLSELVHSSLNFNRNRRSGSETGLFRLNLSATSPHASDYQEPRCGRLSHLPCSRCRSFSLTHGLAFSLHRRRPFRKHEDPFVYYSHEETRMNPLLLSSGRMMSKSPESHRTQDEDLV
eukprot:scaffold2174_cov67-Skeletonema_dohrnii-CCMP3373.AAC.2